MKLAVLSHDDCTKHQMELGHPECPDRVKVIHKYLSTSQITPQIDFIEAKLIDKNLLRLAHDEKYIEHIFGVTVESGLVKVDPDTSMMEHTLNAALRASGSVVQAVDLVMNNQYKRVFCNVRPPGHHATKDETMGFCFFNNIAVGALYALEQSGINKVAIIDFDVHQGNGTIDIINNHSDIFYASSYQPEFYPYVDTPSKENFVGIELESGANSKLFRKKYTNAVFNKLQEFSPDIIFISAGFDALHHDPLADVNLTENDFYWITHQLVDIANMCADGRVISALEGGYKLPDLGACALAHCYGLLETPFDV